MMPYKLAYDDDMRDKQYHTPYESTGGVLISFLLAVSQYVSIPLSLRRVASVSPDLHGYVPGIRASPPFHRYQMILMTETQV